MKSAGVQEEGGGGCGQAAALMHFSAKDLVVDWDKVSRVTPLVKQALGEKREESSVVTMARRLEKFYPHLVRWDVTRSKSGITANNLMELFRLAQVVLEARTMDSEDQRAALTGEITMMKEQIATAQDEQRDKERETEALKAQLSACEAKAAESERQLAQSVREAEALSALAQGAEKDAAMAELQEQLKVAKRQLDMLQEQQAARDSARTAELLDQQRREALKKEEEVARAREAMEARARAEKELLVEQHAREREAATKALSQACAERDALHSALKQSLEVADGKRSEELARLEAAAADWQQQVTTLQRERDVQVAALTQELHTVRARMSDAKSRSDSVDAESHRRAQEAFGELAAAQRTLADGLVELQALRQTAAVERDKQLQGSSGPGMHTARHAHGADMLRAASWLPQALHGGDEHEGSAFGGARNWASSVLAWLPSDALVQVGAHEWAAVPPWGGGLPDRSGGWKIGEGAAGEDVELVGADGERREGLSQTMSIPEVATEATQDGGRGELSWRRLGDRTSWEVSGSTGSAGEDEVVGAREAGGARLEEGGEASGQMMGGGSGGTGAVEGSMAAALPLFDALCARLDRLEMHFMTAQRDARDAASALASSSHLSSQHSHLQLANSRPVSALSANNGVSVHGERSGLSVGLAPVSLSSIDRTKTSLGDGEHDESDKKRSISSLSHNTDTQAHGMSVGGGGDSRSEEGGKEAGGEVGGELDRSDGGPRGLEWGEEEEHEEEADESDDDIVELMNPRHSPSGQQYAVHFMRERERERQREGELIARAGAGADWPEKAAARLGGGVHFVEDARVGARANSSLVAGEHRRMHEVDEDDEMSLMGDEGEGREREKERERAGRGERAAVAGGSRSPNRGGGGQGSGDGSFDKQHQGAGGGGGGGGRNGRGERGGGERPVWVPVMRVTHKDYESAHREQRDDGGSRQAPARRALPKDGGVGGDVSSTASNGAVNASVSGASSETREVLQRWVHQGRLMRHARMVVDIVHCTWQTTERDKLKGERKHNLSLHRNDDDKYMRYTDDVSAMLRESLPRAIVRVNQHPNASPRPPIGAFEVILRQGLGADEPECVLFSKLERRRWPNSLNLQRALEGALGYQRVVVDITVAIGSADASERHRGPMFNSEQDRYRQPHRQESLMREWGHGGVGGWTVLGDQELDIYSVKGEMMQANMLTSGTIVLDVLDEDLQRVVARHGGERLSQRGTTVRTDERGVIEMRVRARGLYLVTTRVGDTWFYGFLSTEMAELVQADRVQRSLLVPRDLVMRTGDDQ